MAPINWERIDVENVIPFSKLEELITHYEYFELLPLLTAIQKEDIHSNHYDKLASRFIKKVSECSYEPIWQDIFYSIQASQGEYKDKISFEYPAEILNNIRASIQTLMEQNGYKGTYPDFTKTGPLHGIHLEESYNKIHLSGAKKNFSYYVHCLEKIDEDDHLVIELICGTSMESAYTNIYSFLFNANGKKVFHTMTYIYTPDSPQDITPFVQTAIKRGKFQFLSKEERQLYSEYGDNSLI